MKIIKYECRSGQIRSRVYDVILFYDGKNNNIIKKTYALHYDPMFLDYNKYVFFPVHRKKWDGATDAPKDLPTLVASADVLLRAMPSSPERDLFLAGFFENPNDFKSIKNELKEFVEFAYNISSKNYYIYLGMQIRYGNLAILKVFDKDQRQKVDEYQKKIMSGDISYSYAGEQIDQLLSNSQQLELYNEVLRTVGEEQVDKLFPGYLGDASELIRKDIKLTLQDISYEPKFRMVVRKNVGSTTGVAGKYSVFLERNGVQDDEPLMFKTLYAKAFYIWLLAHTNEKIKKEDMDRNQLIRIFKEIYRVEDKIKDKLWTKRGDGSYFYQSDAGNNQQLLNSFITTNKPEANRTVIAALRGVYDHTESSKDPNTKNIPLRDEEKWYTIQFNDQKQYYINLPKDYVEIPESLSQLIDNDE